MSPARFLRLRFSSVFSCDLGQGVASAALCLSATLAERVASQSPFRLVKITTPQNAEYNIPDPILGASDCDPGIYERIGRIATEWSWVELLLSDMLSYFCRAESGSMYVITQSVSISSIIGWLQTLVEIKVQDLQTRDTLLDLLREIDSLRTERNTAVHGIWLGGGAPVFAMVQTMRWGRAEVVKSQMNSISDLDDVI